MKNIILTITVAVAFFTTNVSAKEKTQGEISLSEILSSYSERTNTKVLIDRKVKGTAIIHGQSISEISLDNLLTILSLNNYTAYKDDGYLIVIPDKSARSAPVPKVKDGETYPDNLVVTNIIKLEKACAIKIIPLLRPLVPQQGHMAAYIDTNSIVLTDRYSNTVKISNIIKELDSSLSKKVKCEYSK